MEFLEFLEKSGGIKNISYVLTLHFQGQNNGDLI